MSITEITRIEVTNIILAGNLGDIGLDTDDCNRISDLTETAIFKSLAEDYPGIPVEITSSVENSSGVGGGVTIEIYQHDEDFGEVPGPMREAASICETLQDISNSVTQDYCEAKDNLTTTS